MAAICALAFFACVRVLDHDPALAARAAVEFGRVALVEGDAIRAHALLSDEAKARISVAILTEALAKMHPAAHPVSVTAMEFEPIPGQEAMSIFLNGANGEERFFYRLVMQGTAGAGYKVAGIFRGSGAYPPSKLRQKLSTQ